MGPSVVAWGASTVRTSVRAQAIEGRPGWLDGSGRGLAREAACAKVPCWLCERRCGAGDSHGQRPSGIIMAGERPGRAIWACAGQRDVSCAWRSRARPCYLRAPRPGACRATRRQPSGLGPLAAHALVGVCGRLADCNAADRKQQKNRASIRRCSILAGDSDTRGDV